MIASVFRLSASDCKALKIRDAYGIHLAVYSLFPKIDGLERDFLFVDKGGDARERKVLILSRRPPGIPQYGSIESRNIPEDFLNHDEYGFEIRLNPTKQEKGGGKIVAIRGKEALLKWFLNKGPSWGFSVEARRLQVQNQGVQSFTKDGKIILHNSATFVGKLKVSDRAAFIRNFEDGLGKGKAFGFGLLQIVPLRAGE